MWTAWLVLPGCAISAPRANPFFAAFSEGGTGAIRYQQWGHIASDLNYVVVFKAAHHVDGGSTTPILGSMVSNG